MMAFTVLTVLAVLSKLLGTSYYTPLTIGLAGVLVVLRYTMLDDYRDRIDAFLLQFGVLTYALANRDPSFYEQVALVFCMVPSLTHLGQGIKLAREEGTCLLLLVYIACSVVWSSNVKMTVAGIIMSVICLGFIFSYVVSFRGDLSRMLHHILLILGVLVVSSIIVGVMGHGAAGQTFAGVTFHRNQFGLLIGLLVLIGLFYIRQRPVLLRGGLILSCVVLLAYVDSKSAVISMVFTSMIWLIASSKRWRIWGGAAALAAVIFFITLPSPKMDYFAIRMGRDPTFTSRTLIWGDSLKLLAEQPFAGFGYNAVWDAFENRLSQYPDAPGPLYAHSFNTLLEWGLQLGAGGVALYLMFLAGIIVRAALVYRRCDDRATCWQAICLLIYVEVYNLANVSSVPINRFGFFMLGSTAACLCLQLSRAQVASCGDAGVSRETGAYERSQL